MYVPPERRVAERRVETRDRSTIPNRGSNTAPALRLKEDKGSKRVRLPSMDSGRPTVSIVVTGDVGAGKTCLIRRYVNNYFPKGSQKSTSSKKRLGLEHSLKVSLRYYWVRCRSVENNRSSQQLKRWATFQSYFKLLTMRTPHVQRVIAICLTKIDICRHS